MKTFLISIVIVILSSCQSNDPKPLNQNSSKAQLSSKAIIKVDKLTSIHIIPLGKVSEKVVNDLVNGLTSFYHKEVIVEKSTPLDKGLLAKSKSRYSGDSILKRFNSSKNSVVISEVDIVTPKAGVTNEWGVFGLGLRPGNVCVISSFRLKKNSSAELLTERLQKVAIHEVGHNLGLDHCTKNSECLMSAANGTINQVDHEKMLFCDNCKKIIGIL
jgi:archaemetzincin